MATIKQLKERGNKIYPLTSSDAVIFPDGRSSSDKFSFITQNYETYQDLVDNLDIKFDVSNKQIKLVLDDEILSTISTDNFAISGVLSSSSYDEGILTLTFTSGDTVNINLEEIISSILQTYSDEVAALRNLHQVMTEQSYETLRVKDSDVFYYIYEDDDEEEITEPS